MLVFLSAVWREGGGGIDGMLIYDMCVPRPYDADETVPSLLETDWIVDESSNANVYVKSSLPPHYLGFSEGRGRLFHC